MLRTNSSSVLEEVLERHNISSSACYTKHAGFIQQAITERRTIWEACTRTSDGFTNIIAKTNKSLPGKDEAGEIIIEIGKRDNVNHCIIKSSTAAKICNESTFSLETSEVAKILAELPDSLANGTNRVIITSEKRSNDTTTVSISEESTCASQSKEEYLYDEYGQLLKIKVTNYPNNFQERLTTDTVWDESLEPLRTTEITFSAVEPLFKITENNKTRYYKGTTDDKNRAVPTAVISKKTYNQMLGASSQVQSPTIPICIGSDEMIKRLLYPKQSRKLQKE